MFQYPHTIVSPGPTPNALQSAEGFIQQPLSVETISQMGRYEPSTSVREITTTDGKTVKPRGIIYMPSSSQTILDGVEVEIIGITKGIVLQFSRDLLGCRLFI